MTLALAAGLAAAGVAERGALDAYLGDLTEGRYADAYARLVPAERAYFRTPRNFASIFRADGVQFAQHEILGERSSAAGKIVIVREQIEYFNHAAQRRERANVVVPYGIAQTNARVEIDDPLHPWKAVRPANTTATADRLRVTVRKVSLFATRIEVVVTFANVGSGGVSIFALGRSLMRDDRGAVLHAIDVRDPAITDPRVRAGLRLEPQTQYTGSMSFATHRIGDPRVLRVSIGPILRDGENAPQVIYLPPISIPADR